MRYPAGVALTMLAVVIGWVAFRAPDLATTWRMYGGMLGLHGVGLSDMLAWQVMPDQWWTGAIAVLVCAVPLGVRWLPWEQPVAAMHPAWRAAWVAAPTLGFLLGLVLLYSRAAVPFLYFQF